MSLPKAKKREVQLVILYMHILNKILLDEEDILEFVSKELKVSQKNVKECIDFVRNIRSHSSTIEDLIKKYTIETYDYDRITSSEKAILILIVYELLFQNELPIKILMSEAMRLTKKFSSHAAVSFVVAVIDSIYKENIKRDETST